MYKKVVKFSFKQQKIIWVLVFSSIYLVLVDAKERSFGSKCFGLAFGGTFTRLEEGSELRRKYNRQEKFNAQLQE